MNKIAIISFSNPFVDNEDGGKIDIKKRIKCLKDMGYQIDHYSLLKNGEKSIESNIIENNYIRKVKNKISFLFSKYPVSVNNRFNLELNEILVENSYKYDCLLFENFNMLKYIEKNDFKRKVFLRVHNIESESRMQLFKSNPFSIKGVLELVEAFKYLYIEKKSLDLVDKFLFISLKEKETFERRFPLYKNKFYWIPTVADISDETRELKNQGDYILYYGDLRISHNIEGLKRFIKNTYAQILKEYKIKLIVIGKINQKDKKDLEKYENVYIKGYVDCLDTYIEDCKFIIAPIYTGAGVKIKVIDAISRGKLLITTPKGIEGTGLVKDYNVLSAENDKEFYNYSIVAIENIEKFDEVKKNGVNYVQKNYSKKSICNRLKELINE